MNPVDLLRNFMLSLTVWREARNQSPLGMRLVAQTILNRVNDKAKRWPTTIVGVVTQKWQFSSFNQDDPNATKFPSESDPSWTKACEAVQVVLNSPGALTTANHYHTKNVKPTWSLNQHPVITEGDHIFYEL